ncbi:uncharacterized protein B0I36DRAFT_314991 [Microdochium trichocladiopsis]|uniref:F-box domain-containing protein n=1 Tax=Microdochium trichocladiopsis TaxID=1682393 RepID=A0A9P8YEB2_9PEZI|nr:uncharacterized protein B0I36DRAFT_314991 [Microdochium trichocladiopsis]KAH7037880.1 hypothetical protein B0I36DRAFT_314991 [Microdochium trichocladiopsis]
MSLASSSSSSVVGTPGSAMVETPLTPPLETPPAKEKRRQKFLRGIQRIGSSSSLTNIGRARSSSAPYGTRGTISCVSLAGTPAYGQFTPGTPSSLMKSYFPENINSGQGSPAVEFPSFEDSDSQLAARKIIGGSTTCLTPGSIALPRDVVATRSRSATVQKPPYDFWANMPDEVRIQIFAYLQPKELVRASRVSKDFYKFAFDGQLWTHLDATEFYQEIPAESLAKIVVAAGPFIQNLNLRGCLQIEHYERAEAVVNACKNLYNASLEGCRNFQRQTLHGLLKNNVKLANLNLTSLPAVTNSTCKIISQHCPQLETLNVSWCKQMDARGVRMVIQGCPKLRDLRAGEVKGFDNVEVAQAIFETNNLERLVLNGCIELTDDALKTMIVGTDPEIDILTDRPVVAPRRWRHLDLSRCTRLTDDGVKSLGYNVPDLEGLQLNGCSALTDSALEPILATTPRLTHLELEDLVDLTNDLLSEHLAKAPCAPILEHLSLSYCENLGDAGMVPVMKQCVSLKSVDLDNTRSGDLVLAEAAATVRGRAARTTSSDSQPKIGMRLVVYDCQFVTWTGIREVLSWNAEVRQPMPATQDEIDAPPTASYPTEIIGLKSFYGWQQTVEQHTARVLKGDFASAARLERKWAGYMQAVEEAGAGGAGVRRRRRRAREAQMLHAHEEGVNLITGRRRARTVAGSCSVM